MMRCLPFILAGAAAISVEARGGRASETSAQVPVIGILAQPSTRTPFKQYVAASYVKWVEMAGGVAVPLSYSASNDTTRHLLDQLDGVLLPGGSNPPLPDAARMIVDYALRAAVRNESFPVWGTCLGFEWLVATLAPGALQTGYDAENISLKLQLSAKAPSSYLLGDAVLRRNLASMPLAMNNHHQGVEPSRFAADSRLAMFDVLSTNLDRQRRPFVSTIEAPAHNLYAVQWHPEKNAFENAWWRGVPFEGINHSAEAVAATFALAQSFVGRARLSHHTFPQRDAWRFENCAAGRAHWPDFVSAYDLPLAWDGAGAPCV